MSSETNGTKFKILIGVLSVLLIALAVYTVSLYNDSKDKVTGLEQQKETIENELEELIANYDEVIQDNELKDKDLLAARDRIEVLLDSVKDAEANVLLIERYKAEVGRLKNERKMLFKRADSLIAVNKRISMERDSTTTALNETIKVVDSVSEENTTMAETIKKGSIVKATDLRGEAVIIRNSGKIVDTRRASRADKIRACFTLAPNAIAKSGDRDLYVQVINPKNNLLGVKETIGFDGSILNYSAKTTVFYENEELDVCVLVDATENNLIEGRYVVNVFDGKTQVATTTMELK
ncbi:MAG: hypothetical protein CMC07_08775 [Flavobacteriaceae bacterium]|jgi:hypothetical protein|nr:hypothetical protein [Flavobacteriaceae bacterium]|tara:strand:+ start:3973 stop:4854 length:882 start_codon:yes stop_codon:yes gene_type:complete